MAFYLSLFISQVDGGCKLMAEKTYSKCVSYSKVQKRFFYISTYLSGSKILNSSEKIVFDAILYKMQDYISERDFVNIHRAMECDYSSKEIYTMTSIDRSNYFRYIKKLSTELNMFDISNGYTIKQVFPEFWNIKSEHKKIVQRLWIPKVSLDWKSYKLIVEGVIE